MRRVSGAANNKTVSERRMQSYERLRLYEHDSCPGNYGHAHASQHDQRWWPRKKEDIRRMSGLCRKNTSVTVERGCAQRVRSMVDARTRRGSLGGCVKA